MTKYKAKKCTMNGVNFDSKAEMNRYCQLRIMQMAGEIKNLKCHPAFDIDYNEKHICKVELDFCYEEDGMTIVEDVKGCDNALSKLKRKMVKAFHNVDVIIIKA